MKSVVGFVVACMLAVTMAACGGKSVKVQVDRADRGAFQALRSFQLAEGAAFKVHAPWPTADQHKSIGDKLSKSYTLVIDVAQIGIDLQPGQSLPAAASAELDELIKTVGDLAALVGQPATPEARAKMDAATSAVKALVAIVKGAK